MTLDRELHKTLSFPGLFSRIALTGKEEASKPEVYCFLKAIRNVKALSIDNAVIWPLKGIHLLSTLNPLQLWIDESLFAFSATEEIEALVKSGADVSGLHIQENFAPTFLPSFERITPRVEHLSLSLTSSGGLLSPKALSLWTFTAAHARGVVKPKVGRECFYRLPTQSLTSFTLGNVFDHSWNDMITALPATLRVLSLEKCFLDLNVAQLFETFPLIVDLHLRFELRSYALPIWKPVGNRTAIPNCLTRFSISVPWPSQAVDFLQSSLFAFSNVTDFEFEAYEEPNAVPVDDRTASISLATLLPPSTTSCKISRLSHPKLTWGIASFPAGLTQLDIREAADDTLFLSTMFSLPHLKVLRLGLEPHIAIIGSEDAYARRKTGGESLFPFAAHVGLFKFIPRSVTSLTVERGWFAHGSPASLPPPRKALKELPECLVSLTLPCFDLDNLTHLNKQAPQCILRISRPISLWNSINGGYLRKPFSASLIFEELLDKINRFCIEKNVRFALDLDHARGSDALATLISSLLINSRLDRHYDALTLLPEDHQERFSSVLKGLHHFSELRVLKINIPSDQTCSTSSVGASSHDDGSSSYNAHIACDLTDFEQDAQPHRYTLEKVSLPKKLSHLELFDSKLAAKLSSPCLKHLTYLSTNTPSLESSWTALPSLKVLRAPRWKFRATDLMGWDLSSCTRLAMTVIGTDIEIVHFLLGGSITITSPFNLNLNLVCTACGIFVPSNGVYEVTWETIVEKTRETMLEIFRTHKTPSWLPSDWVSIKTAIDHRAIKKMTITETCTDEQGIFFPRSVKRISLVAPLDILWRGCGFIDNRVFPSSLTRLEVGRARVSIPEDFDDPKALLFFQRTMNYRSGEFGLHLLTNLRVLVLEEHVSPLYEPPTDSSLLPFSLSALPTSLRHVCITRYPSYGHHKQYALETPRKLDRLKTLLLIGWHPCELLHFMRKLIIKSIERIDVVLASDFVSKRAKDGSKLEWSAAPSSSDSSTVANEIAESMAELRHMYAGRIFFHFRDGPMQSSLVNDFVAEVDRINTWDNWWWQDDNWF